MKLPRHPDTILGLSPDCRRVLRADYERIQTAAQPARVEARRINGGETEADYAARVQAAEATRRVELAAAIAEYRRTAAAWGIDRP